MRIAIIDDDRLVCDSLGIILGAQEDIEVVGCGCNGDDAVRLTREAAPDVLLMDIQMPGRDGLSAAREILGEGGRTRVVFLITFSDDEYIVGALRLGASGYLIKQDVAVIAPALREVMAGRRVLEGRAMEDVNFSGGDDVAARPSRPAAFACLTEREYEVAELIAQGLDNREIAAAAYMGEGTVRNHISSILVKLGLRNRTQIAIAYLRGSGGLSRRVPSGETRVPFVSRTDLHSTGSGFCAGRLGGALPLKMASHWKAFLCERRRARGAAHERLPVDAISERR